MMILKNEKKNVKNHYAILHYNEIFKFTSLYKLGISPYEITEYTINEPCDYFVVCFREDIPIKKEIPRVEKTVKYSDLNFHNVIAEYDEYLKSINFDMYINGNIILGAYTE